MRPLRERVQISSARLVDQRRSAFRSPIFLHQHDRAGVDRDAAQRLHRDPAKILVDMNHFALEPDLVAWLGSGIDDRIWRIGRRDMQGTRSSIRLPTVAMIATLSPMLISRAMDRILVQCVL